MTIKGIIGIQNAYLIGELNINSWQKQPTKSFLHHTFVRFMSQPSMYISINNTYKPEKLYNGVRPLEDIRWKLSKKN